MDASSPDFLLFLSSYQPIPDNSKYMLEALITSKTRVKILLKFFLNKANKSYLRSLEQEFGESSNAIRIELNRFEEAGLLTSYFVGNKKFFQANTDHPLFNDINSILIKMVGIDAIIKNIAKRLSQVEKAYLTGDLARGINSNKVELLLVGEGIDESIVLGYTTKAESITNRKITYQIMQEQEAKDYLSQVPSLLIWINDHSLLQEDKTNN